MKNPTLIFSYFNVIFLSGNFFHHQKITLKYDILYKVGCTNSRGLDIDK